MPDVNLSPIDAQQAAILRKRQLAQTLQQMSLQPIESPPVPGAAISPWQGAAKLAQALVAVYKNKKLDKEQAALTAQDDAQRQTQAQGLASALAGPGQGSTVNLPTPQPQMMAPAEGDGYVQSNPTPQSSPMAPPPNAQQAAQHQQLIAALGQGIASKDPNIVDFTKSLATDLLQGRRSDQEAMQAMERLNVGQQGENQRQLAGFGQQAKMQGSQQAFEQTQQAAQQAFQGGQGDLNRGVTQSEGALDRKNQRDIASTRSTSTEYDQKVAAFNADPSLVKQFGAGPNGYAKWVQSMAITTAGAGAQARENVAKSDDPRLARVDPKVQPVVLDKVQKVDASYNAALRAADDMSSVVADALKGNKVAASYSPVLGVLEINTANGTKRINRNEIEMYAGAGSAFDRVAGWFGKNTAGQPIPANILADMRGLSQTLTANAKTAHDRDLSSIDDTYRSSFAPKNQPRKYNPATGKIE